MRWGPAGYPIGQFLNSLECNNASWVIAQKKAPWKKITAPCYLVKFPTAPHIACDQNSKNLLFYYLCIISENCSESCRLSLIKWTNWFLTVSERFGQALVMNSKSGSIWTSPAASAPDSASPWFGFSLCIVRFPLCSNPVPATLKPWCRILRHQGFSFALAGRLPKCYSKVLSAPDSRSGPMIWTLTFESFSSCSTLKKSVSWSGSWETTNGFPWSGVSGLTAFNSSRE